MRIQTIRLAADWLEHAGVILVHVIEGLSLLQTPPVRRE